MYDMFREYIISEMWKQDPEGFANHEPAVGKKVLCTPLVALGPHHEWSADGHNKLSKLGFPIYSI